jgi:hypothetical protein
MGVDKVNFELNLILILLSLCHVIPWHSTSEGTSDKRQSAKI